MSNLMFDQQYYCRSVGPNELALDDCLTHEFHSNPACIADRNALGLYGMCQPESDWAEDVFPHPSATSIPNQMDSHFLDTSESFSQEFSPSDGLVHFWQPHAPHHPFFSEAGAFTGVGDGTPVLHSSQTIAVPGNFAASKPTVGSQSRHVTASRLSSQSTPQRSLRHAPYPMDHTRQSASPTSGYQCHWSDGAGLCGAFVLGTKNAIGKHLQTAHAIQLKADKTDQVCHWEGCRKSMRRESVVRHTLAVHVQDKVACPSCGSGFARADSLQRHQRKQCLAKGETLNRCKAGK